MRAEPHPELDRLGLLATRQDAAIRVGGVDVRPVMAGATFHEGISERPHARLTLRETLASGLVIDYLAPVTFELASSRRPGPRFAGDVMSASPDGERIELDLSSMPQLSESIIGLFAAWNVPHVEHIHALTRSAGLGDDQLNIEGLDELPKEVFEVVVPIRGLLVEGQTVLGQVTFAAPARATSALAELTEDAGIREPFERADCVAVCLTTAHRMFDAEEQALADVDQALSWLAVTLRYGQTHWPDGVARRFERAEFRALPERADVAWVRGVVNGRQWARTTGPEAVRPRLDLEPRHLDVQPPRSLSLQDREAIQALRRAAAATDPIQAVTAIWDAVEFYVAGRAGPRIFDDAALKALRKAVPQDLPPQLRQRAIDSINRLNQLPLLSRLRAAVEEDGVPTTDEEWALLQRLRRSRNALVHGAAADAAAPADDLLRVQSFVARLLVYRAHRLREEA